MAIPNSDPEKPDSYSLEFWLHAYQQREAEYQQWLEQREAEKEEQEQAAEERIEQAILEEQRRDDDRRLDEQQQEEQRRRDEQQRRNEQRRRSTSHEIERPQKVQEIDRGNYIQPPQRQPQLSRHDRYNIETAHELEAAADRARSQGIDPANEKQFQHFLNGETEQGIHQPEGKRPLSERYQELLDRRDQATALIERGASRDRIPELSLQESDWEQDYRIAHQREIRQADRVQSNARDRLAQIRSTRDPVPTEPTSARDKLAQTRAEYGIEPREPSARSQSKQR